MKLWEEKLCDNMSFEFLPGNLISSTFTKFKNNKQLFWLDKKNQAQAQLRIHLFYC